MIIEVDQSIKVERTNKGTVIGIANKKQTFTAVVPAKVKSKLQSAFRKAGQPRLYVYRTFIAAVVLTLKKSKWRNISDVVIDKEYIGQEHKLKSIFLEMWSRDADEVPDVSFKEIGKRSCAHEACYQTMQKKRKPDAVLTFGEIKRLALK